MIVMKFGGTSLETVAAMQNVARIVERELGRSPLVVLSACAGVTNALVRTAALLASGNEREARKQVADLAARHRNLWNQLQPDADRTPLEALLAELESVASSGRSTPDDLPRLTDAVASFGERLSSLVFATYLRQRGITATLVDARSMMITDNQFTFANPNMVLIEQRAGQVCKPLLAPGHAVVTQGFIGSTPDGLVTTIGRGGSDYSAAIFGAVLNAEEIQIWTDVDGVLTADPRLVAGARRIKYMTFREAAELAYFGAKVLHPKTILPAIEKGIPVRVLNSKRPGVDGTLISRENLHADHCIVKSVAYKPGITLINIESTRMLMAYGFLARLFEVFARHRKAVDVIATSEIGVSLTVDDPTSLDDICAELCTFADVEVLPRRAVLCVVGENMRSTKGVAARIFSALDRAGVNVELISHGGSEVNLTMVVREQEIPNAVRALHEEFFAVTGISADVFE